MKIFDLIDQESPWKDKTPASLIEAQAKTAVAEILSGNNYTKQKCVYRIAGQSGSGKTTQLLPTILKYEELKGRTPVIIGVRSFAKYHPKYSELAADLQRGEIREATNGFALKCLCAAYAILLREGYLTVLDLTIMEGWFEDFMLAQVKNNNYKAEYHILAVNKTLSNSFIEKRKMDTSSAEYGKIVNPSSIDYWYDALPQGVQFLAKNDKTNECFVWSAYEKNPMYCGCMINAAKALETGRALDEELTHDEDTLRRSKLDFLLNYSSGKTTSL